MRDDSNRTNERKARAINRGTVKLFLQNSLPTRAGKSGLTGRVMSEKTRTQTVGEVNQGVSILQTNASISLLDTFSIFTTLRRTPG